MKTRVQDVMTSPAVVASTTDGFKETVARIKVRGISALPVVDEAGRVVGVVSEADLMMKEERERMERWPRFLDTPRASFERAKAEAETVAEAMTRPALTIRPDAPIAEAARQMHAHGVKRLPVVDPEGRPLGVVSRTDLLKVFLRPDEDIRQEILTDVIAGTLWVEPGAFTVSVSGGVVQVGGEVERRSDLRVVEKLISQVEGVVAVHSSLTYLVDDRKLRMRPDELSKLAP